MDTTTVIKQSKLYKFSTQSSSGICLNQDSSYKSSFHYTLPALNFHEEDIESVYLSVPYVSLPVSFYNIDSHNNILDIFIIYSQTVVNVNYMLLPEQYNRSIVFKPGHYNVNNFLTEFKRVTSDLVGGNLSITYDKFTNKFTISHSDPQYYIQILETSTISSVMGFSSSISNVYSNGKYFIEMPRVANFLYTPIIHMRCYEIANSHLVGVNGNDSENDILLSIPNDSGANGKIIYKNSSNLSTLLDIPYLHYLTIHFSDSNGNLINFNGVSLYFELQVDIYRRRSIERKPTFRKLIAQLSSILE